MRTNDEIMDILDQRKEELGLSISEIGRQTNTAKSAISMYFNRKRELPLNRINKFAEVFQLDEEYLLGFDNIDLKSDKFCHLYQQLNSQNQAKAIKYIQHLLSEQTSK